MESYLQLLIQLFIPTQSKETRKPGSSKSHLSSKARSRHTSFFLTAIRSKATWRTLSKFLALARHNNFTQHGAIPGATCPYPTSREQFGIRKAANFKCNLSCSKSARRCSKSSKPIEIRSSNGEMALSHFRRHSTRLSLATRIISVNLQSLKISNLTRSPSLNTFVSFTQSLHI